MNCESNEYSSGVYNMPMIMVNIEDTSVILQKCGF